MRIVFRTLISLATASAVAIWLVLINVSPASLAGFGTFAAFAMYYAAAAAIPCALAVVALGDRTGLQFVGAVDGIAALVGLAAFHSTYAC